MKIWDIGGQFQYRQNWVDYAKMGDIIIFMIDGSNVSLYICFIYYIIFNSIYSMIRYPLQKKNYMDY